MIVLDIKDIARARITLTLIFLNLISFIMINLFLGDKYLLMFAQINQKVLNLEFWRLFTSMFMHADILHLLSNSIALLLFGALLESIKYISLVKYLAIYFISGLIGNIFSLFLFPINTISLGASGCIFGLIGAAFILIIKENPPLFILASIYIVFFIISSFGLRINFIAHIFGLIGGISLGYVFYKRGSKEFQYQYR
ncbi:MAG: rhomboid family intramembrane serine protease [Candidatus Lokiarchaeota archaeon]